MGASNSQNFISQSELSEDESDSEYFQVEMRTTATFMIDAVLRSHRNSGPGKTLSPNRVRGIEQKLDQYEIVALTYLLYDRAEIALQTLIPFLCHTKDNVLTEWVNSESRNNPKWQSKFIEAMCIIQNYQILKEFGYNKEELKAQYVPEQPEVSELVNKKRKSLYLLAEKLNTRETEIFLYNMRKAFEENHEVFQDYDFDYLELYFLDWEQRTIGSNYIKRSLKIMDKEHLYEISENLSRCEINDIPENNDIEIETQKKVVKKASTTRDTTFMSPNENVYSLEPASSSSMMSVDIRHTDQYVIDPEYPGVVLIINQEHFYTEFNPEYKHLLHRQQGVKLQTRVGTEIDKKRIVEVFEKFNFKIIIKDNLAHYDVVKAIEEVTINVTKESSLVVFILSHGDKGVIYGANSCRVEVDKIGRIMKKKNCHLAGRPKVLILQSCQGSHCQQRDESSDDEMEYATDGPKIVPSSAADFLTFWATIPGYAAIRNINQGSWLIQTLCQEIENNASRCHLMDICTKVQDRISSKEWKEITKVNIMTPEIRSTLRKAFYLPRMRSAR
ncbi:caspase-8 [Sitophilus oryzae]|uniref:Caspase-8 n=1 Tax=Sitophilus oryzae TaxID=7048 RepID=A0A6J2XJ59_SITOR|nr:caspase-8 [Sitophilus oryzae]